MLFTVISNQFTDMNSVLPTRFAKSKDLLNMNTFCDWLSEIIVINVYNSFLRNYISIVLSCPSSTWRSFAKGREREKKRGGGATSLSMSNEQLLGYFLTSGFSWSSFSFLQRGGGCHIS